MMKMVLCEKPSVMRDVAAVIGADKSENGFMRGNGYIVAAAVGHLVRLKEPQEYDERYVKWSISDLPIIPDFELVPIEKTVDVLNKLVELMNSSEVDEIIEATDAGREGECIFRYIYNYAKCKKPVKRLWISSLTSESIKNGFENLRPVEDYDSVFDAGFARAKIDWLWGMNLSRLYSIYFNSTSRIGRVKTALVNMIVQRDIENEAFVKKLYYKLKLPNGAEWFDENGDYFTTRLEAEKVLQKCEGQPCKVVSAKSVQKKENRPLLYSLTTLQADANEKYGLTAQQTLDTVQSLYEKKMLTYPRTDSFYLTEDMAAILPDRVKNLRNFFPEAVDELLENGLNIDSRIINNSKVSDHHAIILTENFANCTGFSEDEKKILEMVMKRFLAALSPQYEYSETEYIFEVCGEKFRLKVKTPINLGWRRFYAEDNEDTPAVNYSENHTLSADNLTISECETQPPKRFTEATLLKAMENIDRRIEDKELAEYVADQRQNSNKFELGTPATRAAIIEEIKKPTNGLLEVNGKSLVTTQKARKFIAALPDEVKSIEMTAAMELQLSAIQQGTVTADEVISAIIGKIRAIIELESGRQHISLAPPREKEVVGKCPKCGGNIYKFVKDKMVMFYCENSPENCIFRVFEDDKFFTGKGKKLTESVLKTLLSSGKAKLTGLKSEKTGKTYDATISFKDYVGRDGKERVGFNMEFEDRKGGKNG